MTTVIIVLALIAVIGGALCYIVYRLWCIVNPLVSGISYFKRAIEDTEIEIAENPKSVNGMTSVCLPRICADFPEFNWHEFKQKSENMLISIFQAITKEDVSLVKEGSEELKYQIQASIQNNRDAHVSETYKDIKIHQTEIRDYRKQEGTVIITIQTSVGYIHYKTQGGGVIEGSETVTKQSRYNVELLYIQDVEKMTNRGKALSVTCSSCGAPIKGLGQKVCEYCGCAVTEVNIHAWSINRYIEA